MNLQIYMPETRKHIPADSTVDSRHVYRTLDREFQNRPAIGIYGLENWLTPSVGIAMHIDPNMGIFIKPEQIPLSTLASMIDTDKVMVFVSENAKFQFTGKNLKVDPNGIIICKIPTDLVAIQRRDGFRAIPPVDENFKLIIGLGAGQELLTNVVDVSRNGLQLDMRAGATEVSVGGYWHTNYFERMSSTSARFDLQIMHTFQGNDIARLRVGCALYQPKPQTIKDFENLVDTIVKARAMSNMKKWYIDLTWWKGTVG
jgi:hypothetical protein